jgi:hypothetical protein
MALISTLTVTGRFREVAAVAPEGLARTRLNSQRRHQEDALDQALRDTFPAFSPCPVLGDDRKHSPAWVYFHLTATGNGERYILIEPGEHRQIG